MMKMLSQGHGVQGRYLGLSEEEFPFESSKIVILPIPFDRTTTYKQGAELGPAALIEASRNLEPYDIETNSNPYLHGIFTASAIQATASEEMIEEAYERSLELIQQGKFVIGLGGEHSVTPPLVKAHAEAYGPISVLQFDAHSDLIPTYEGNPLSHASAMARVREIGQVKNIVSVGIRSMSTEESEILDRPNTFFAHDLHGNQDWMDKVVNNLGEKVYITFDLDAFDSSLMPSTGTPEPGGLFWHQATNLLLKVAQKKKIIGFDVVELCPMKNFAAPDFLAAKLVYKMISYIYRGL
jgi:agmatinase